MGACRHLGAGPFGYLDIHSFLSERSPAAAERMLARFAERFEALREFPYLGPDRSEFRPSLRGLLIDGYVASYLVEPDRIVIVRVIDGRRDVDQEFSR